MQITVPLFGWVLLIAGSLGICFRPRWLYWGTLFFMPFTATVVVIIHFQDGDPKGIQASLWFGILWIVSEVWRDWHGLRKRMFYLLHMSAVRSLIGYAVVVGISLLMPVLFSGTVIPSARLDSDVSTILSFRFYHLTHYMYLIYGIIFALILATFNHQERTVDESLRIAFLGGAFACVWGIIQIFLHYCGIPYPQIFNNSVHSAAQGFTAVLQGGGKRISSVATEPSILAQFLLTLLPLLLSVVFSKIPIFSKKRDGVLLALVAVVAVLTTSSTAIYGLAFIGVLLILAIWRFGDRPIRGIVCVIISLSFLMLVSVIPEKLPDFIGGESVVKSAGGESVSPINKLATYSGTERLQSMKTAFQLFLKAPLLGLGWGSVTSHDLFCKILSNSGIVGLVFFLAFAHFLVSGHILQIFREKSHWRRIRLLGTLGSLLTLFFVSTVGGWNFIFSYFWFTVGLSISLLADGNPREAN